MGHRRKLLAACAIGALLVGSRAQAGFLDKVGGAIGGAVGGVVDTVKKAGEDTVNTVKKAGDDAANTVKKAGDDTANTVKKAGDDAASTVKKAGDDTANTVKKAGDDAANTVKKAGDDTANTVKKAGDDAANTVKKAGDDTVNTVKKAGDDTINALKKAGDDTVNSVKKAADDGVKTYVKAWEDTADAGRAVAKFTENQLKGTVDSAVAAGNRIREGKIADAVWHFSTDPLKKTSDNAAAAAAESDVLRTAGAVAASAYGGPAGAAAYAAWYTYSQTKNLNLALKAGLIAGAMSVTVPAGTGIEGQIATGAAKGALAAAVQGGDAESIKAGLIAGGVSSAVTAVGNMPAETTGEVAKKALVAGAVGGIAVAAAGGDKEAVKKAFLEAGGSVVVQYAQAEANAAAAKLVRDVDTHCMSAIGANCTVVVTTAKETVATIQNVKEQIKGVANEQFAISWTDNVTKEGNTVPSVVLTYSEKPLQISDASAE
jgi:vacuolar-type H+-ATPase subunit H